MLAFLLGLLIGGPLGVITYALVAVNNRDEWKD